jgi:hypothetical protein
MADWTRHFDEPIPLPDGRLLQTLLDAGQYIASLPRALHQRSEWRTATGLLLMAADGRGPAMFANVALFKALRADEPKKKRALRRKATKRLAPTTRDRRVKCEL